MKIVATIRQSTKRIMNIYDNSWKYVKQQWHNANPIKIINYSARKKETDVEKT